MTPERLREIYDKPPQERIPALLAEIADLEERLRQAGRGSMPCQICNLPVMFEFTADSVCWNRLVRAAALPEYICFWCFDRIVTTAAEHTTIGVNLVGVSVLSDRCESSERVAELEAALKEPWVEDTEHIQLRKKLEAKDEQILRLQERLKILIEACHKRDAGDPVWNKALEEAEEALAQTEEKHA